MFNVFRPQTRIISLNRTRPFCSTRVAYNEADSGPEKPRKVRTPPEPSADLFVGNVPSDSGPTLVAQAFSRYAPKKVRLGTDAFGKALRFATLRFDTIEEATRVVEESQQNPPLIKGRPLNVEFTDHYSKRHLKETSRIPPSSCLHLLNVPAGTKEQDVWDLLQDFGPLKWVTMRPQTDKKGNRRIVAHVQFQNKEDAIKAMEVFIDDGLYINGTLLLIEYFDPLARGPSPSLSLRYFGKRGELEALLAEKGVKEHVRTIDFAPRAGLTFIHMNTVEDATNAMHALDGSYTRSGSMISAVYSHSKKRRPFDGESPSIDPPVFNVA